MKHKKRPLQGCNPQSGVVQGLCHGILHAYYIISRRKCKPLFGQGRRCLSVSLELVLMTIGTGWLTRLLFRVIDLIERR